MEPTAIRNKKSGRFLIVESEPDSSWDWGYDGRDERMVESKTAYLALRESQYPSILFLTDDPNLLKTLLEKGKCTSPDVRIQFGYGFALEDLEAVVLTPNNISEIPQDA